MHKKSCGKCHVSRSPYIFLSLHALFFLCVCKCSIITMLYKVVEGNLFIVALTVVQPAEHFVFEFCKINH